MDGLPRYAHHPAWQEAIAFDSSHHWQHNTGLLPPVVRVDNFRRGQDMRDAGGSCGRYLVSSRKGTGYVAAGRTGCN